MQIVLLRKKDSASYNSWHNARQRCNDPNSKDYPRYGGRGIKVCERWDNFANFLEDMGERPEGMSLDRIDNNANYEPSNCRWSTRKEQTHNSSVCKLTMLKVTQIREAYSRKGITQLELAAQYGTTQSVVSRIINNKIW